MDVGKRQVTVDGRSLDLTATEFDLLRTLMEHPGYVWTRANLIRTALGSDFEGIDRTVDSHMHNLRRKVEVNPKAPIYIQTVYGVGYSLEAQEADE